MSSRRRSRWSSVALLALTPLVLGACSIHTNEPQDTFTPEGPIARKIFHLAEPVFLIAVLMGIFVYALVLFAAFKYRRKSEDDIPKQIHGNAAMEIGWTIVPAVLLAVIGVFSVGAVFVQAETPKDAYNITVVGHQWWWEFHYPQAGQDKLDSRLETTVDPLDVDAAKEEKREPRNVANRLVEHTPVVVNANELHIPAGRSVRMLVTSQDVIHSFWIPKLAGKIDVVPGRANHINVDTDLDDAGKVFYAQCAEFCGASHADMRFKVHVDAPEAFAAWIQEQQGPVIKATGDPTKLDSTDRDVAAAALVAKGQALFEGGGGCTVCHYTDSSKMNDYGIVGKIGPNLTHVGSRTHFAGAIAELTDANLKAWLRNPQEFKPGSRMVVRKFTEDEVEALVAYIKSLK